MPTTILVVEDEQPIQDVLYEVLMDEGYDVATVWNGAEALGWMEQHCPDVILSDIMMPVLDGVRLCQLVHANPTTCHAPIILMSAITQPMLPEVCRPYAFLAKPFSLTQIIDTVAGAVTAA
jgi:CheY-like chemotaxis protein